MKRQLIKYLSSSFEYREALTHYGISGLVEEIRLRKAIWSLDAKSIKRKVELPTSITDRPEYLEICELAAENEYVLANFKRCRDYRLVLEHVSRYQGEQYLNYIINDEAIIKNVIDVSKREVGNPFLFEYPQLGRVSPTQIRYAKILKDLITIFDMSKVKSIAEVGVGNGGQAAQIINFLDINSYELIDLPEVLELTRKTIAPYIGTTELGFTSAFDNREFSPDLFISNYAFSELTKSVQLKYIQEVVKNSRNGYILYNHIHKDSTNSLSVFEFQKLIPNSIIESETPNTFKDNYLIVWGENLRARS